ncbi:hypothetical protein ACFLY7_01085 [Patescibacteria group bacterium]
MIKNYYKRIFLIMLFLNMLAIAGYTLFLIEIQGKSQNIASILGKMRTQNEKDVELKIIDRNLRETKVDRARINKYFISEDGQEGVVGFIEDIEGLSESIGLSIDVNSLVLREKEGIQISKKRIQKSSLDILRLNFSISGSWNKVVKFLGMLELVPVKINLSKAYFEKSTREDEVEIWNGRFEIDVLKLR